MYKNKLHKGKVIKKEVVNRYTIDDDGKFTKQWIFNFLKPYKRFLCEKQGRLFIPNPLRSFFTEEGEYKVFAYVQNHGSKKGGGDVTVTVSEP